MNYTSTKADVLKQKTHCAVVFCAGTELLESAARIDKACNGLLSAVVSSKDLGESSGQHLWLPMLPKAHAWERVLLIQLGKPEGGKKAGKRIAEKSISALSTKLGKLLTTAPIKDAVIYLDDMAVTAREGLERDNAWIPATIVEKTQQALYRFSMKKSPKGKAPSLKKLHIASTTLAPAKLKAAVAQAAALGEGLNLARELGNLPGNVCTPTYLADLAKQLAKSYNNVSSKSLGEKQMEKLGMHAFLSVSKGSDEEGKLIIMEYKGAESAKPNVLVGKGITFDTGGISLKPPGAMDEMKYDMCGAASVFGAIKALAEMQAKVHVVGIVAAAENMPSGRASKPGDIVTSMSGQTIEILNTDAEGRLVLCDALSYAERYKPKSIVDIATLTGAVIVALGSHATGLYANNQALAKALLDAGERANDRAWQMPLWDEYQKQLDSNFADIANIGGPKGGSVTAACFLSRFTKKQKWAHLDVAGSAFTGGTATKGASGRPVGLLVDYLLNN